MPPTLSICVPTWHRADLLAETLQALTGIGLPSFEVVVSDNASDDATPGVVRTFVDRLPLRYARQKVNVGAEANVVSALRLARGTFCTYLADDDRLLPGGLEAALSWLAADRARSAVFAPWELHDTVNNTVSGVFYPQPDDEDYREGEGVRMLGRLCHRVALPEIGVFRTVALHRVLAMPRRVHWAHVWAANLLLEGPVHLQRQPFYRFSTRTELKRAQLGTAQARTHLDRYRGGVEVALTVVQQGRPPLPANVSADLMELVHGFAAQRALVASRLAAASGDARAAWELAELGALRLPNVPMPPAPPASPDRTPVVSSTSDTRLSICVPARTVAGLVATLAALPSLPSVEVVVAVGDDAFGEAVAGTIARIVRLEPNTASHDALARAALEAAAGTFALVLEEGETLDGEALGAALDHLSAHPSILALTTPAETVAAEPLTFGPSRALNLLARALVWGVRPELALYRTAALGALALPRTGPAAYSWFYGLITRGELCLDPRPHRRWVRPPDVSLDALRSAVERTLLATIGPGGLDALPEAHRRELTGLVEQFLGAHLLAEARHAVANHAPLDALELRARWRAWHPDLPAASPAQLDAAAVELVRTAAETTAGWEGLVLCDVDAPLKKRFAALSPRVTREPQLTTAAGLVLTGTRATAERLRARLPTGQILAWEDVRAYVARLG